MKIRLSKVIKDLNVGMSTVVEYLQKNGFGIEADANPNTQISEEQYEALRKEFSKDKNIKKQSDIISFERQNKEKNKKSTVAIEGYEEKQDSKEKAEMIKTEIPKEQMLKLKPVGKINLDEHNNPIKKEEKTGQTAKTSPDNIGKSNESKTVEKNDGQAQTAETHPTEADNKETPSSQQTKTNTVTEQKQQEDGQAESDKQTRTAETGETTEKDVYKIHSQGGSGLKLNVVGQIDLDSINQSTRPKKKSKEEKKKEREEKDRLKAEQRKKYKENSPAKDFRPEDKQSSDQHDKFDNDADKKNKKKRNRINKEKIDINNVGSFVPQKKANNAGKPQQQQPNEKAVPKHKMKKLPPKPEVNEEDVAKQVKETLARLTSKGKSKASKYRKEKRENVMNKIQEMESHEMEESKVLKLTEFVTANELANMMNISVNQVISTCMSIGIMVSINQRLDAETINLVAEEFGFKTEYVSASVAQAVAEEEDKAEDLQPRAPIVTVMGHVDHGKTSLLDYIRKSNVIAGEAGGITQHIGAYNVTLDDGRKITFLDTPGHEAFTAMRARGAKVTDIAIIIVAADDDVMPQTKEAINHATAAGVPIVFAINKIDKPHANPDKIKEALANMNYLVEEWGGKYQSQDISAKKGTGVNDLLEKVLLEAEMLDLKANPDRKATGSIIESTLDKGRGYVATVLVSNGTLKMGDIVLAGTNYGKIKAMFNERNQRITQAGPSEPALILGLNGAPAAGDTFHVIETEQEAREIANKREQLQREQGLRTRKILTLDEVGRRLALGSFKELNIIVKGDVDGSIEALSDSLIKLSTETIQVNVIHKAVGQISESDVALATASDAIIIGFQVRPSAAARKFAEQEGVEIRLYSIIYDAIEEVKAAMEGMLAPEVKEQVTSTIEVKEVFHISKVGMVAGAVVKDGKVKRTDKARLVRDGIVIYTGAINALKRFKDDVKEVAVNYECGISLTNCNDLKVGDIIETYEEIEVKQTL